MAFGTQRITGRIDEATPVSTIRQEIITNIRLDIRLVEDILSLPHHLNCGRWPMITPVAKTKARPQLSAVHALPLTTHAQARSSDTRSTFEDELLAVALRLQ